MKFGIKINKERALPLILTAIIVIVDQISKAIIYKNWPLSPFSNYRFITDVFDNDFLHIIHVRNTAIAFSLGQNIPENIKPVLFIILPVLVLLALIWYYLSSDDFTKLQRWATAGILGGGIGNIIDRIFPPDGVPGVVDFISVRFYGLFGFERWPTFNIADSSVVVCCIMLFLTIIIGSIKTKSKKNNG